MRGALCALTAGIYLTVMGRSGLAKAATLSTSKAHYLQKELEAAGFAPKYDKPFFNEFVTKTPADASEILEGLEKYGILGGLALSSDEILWCTTEKNTKADIDELVKVLKEVCK